MQKLNIADGYSLMIEPNEDNLRVVLVNESEELACHKIKPKHLREFIYADEAQLFKGRLQLYNNCDTVSVKLRGTELGIIDKKQISAMVENVLSK